MLAERHVGAVAQLTVIGALIACLAAPLAQDPLRRRPERSQSGGYVGDREETMPDDIY
jgi:hypothetical protein